MMKSDVNILVVEDEAFAAMTLRMILKGVGYTKCHFVATGEDALAYVEQAAPDIILMDIRLAGKLNGIETIQQIKGFCQTVPVIFMTGYTDQIIQEKIRSLNPTGVFEKPLPIPELLASIESVIAQ